MIYNLLENSGAIYEHDFTLFDPHSLQDALFKRAQWAQYSASYSA